jgi:hypothetical protein
MILAFLVSSALSAPVPTKTPVRLYGDVVLPSGAWIVTATATATTRPTPNPPKAESTCVAKGHQWEGHEYNCKNWNPEMWMEECSRCHLWRSRGAQ